MNDENFEKSSHSVQLPEEGHQTALTPLSYTTIN